MPKKSLLTAVLAAASLLSTTVVFAKDGQQIKLPDGHTAVISTGDLEPASIGSYTVSVYKDLSTGSFMSGIILPRDGSVFTDAGKARVDFADITGNGQRDMIVKMVSAGSGNYVSGDALQINKAGKISRISHVEDLSPNTDVTAALKRAYQRTERRHERAARRADRR